MKDEISHNKKEENRAERKGQRNLRASAFRRNLGNQNVSLRFTSMDEERKGMGGFCVKRYGGNDGGDPKHYCSLIFPDLSVSKDLELPFGNGAVVIGSCGHVLYFYDLNGYTFIFNNIEKDERPIVIPPPKGLTPKNSGQYRSCGISYDAKSGAYKVIRIYTTLIVVNDAGELDLEYNFDLYSGLCGSAGFCGSAKYITRPTQECCIKLGNSIYVGEAGSGSGSCYWLAWLYDPNKSDPLNNHVLSFDFATESFHQFPLPVDAKGHLPCFELVECRGSIGVLVYWTPPDEFSLEAYKFSSDLSVRLFVRNGKGTSWDLLYDVKVADALRPLGLKDRLLFLLAAPTKSSCDDYQLMVYNLASKTLKKLGIYDCDRYPCGICYGDKRKKKKKNKGKGKGKGKGKEK